jgi:hypothetical protein
MQYSSLSSIKPSDMATTVFGGWKVATWTGQGGRGRGARWLADTYVEAYRAVLAHCKPSVEEEGIPQVFERGKLLRPILIEGTRGGSAFLVMLGNLLAFRKNFEGVEEATPKMLKHLARVVDETLDHEHTGQSAANKRDVAGRFVRAYFEDIVVPYGEKASADKPRLGAIDDVPYALIQLWGSSTVDVDKKLVPKLPRPEPSAPPLNASVEDLSRPQAAPRPTAKQLAAASPAAGVGV